MEGPVITLVLIVSLIQFISCVTIVQVVDFGATAILTCPSNDDNHRFQFWQLDRDNLMIGPDNPFNRDKYKYEVLTGTLYIKGVSSNEHGLYTCVCRHLTDGSFYSETVELVVKKIWSEDYQHQGPIMFSSMFGVTLFIAIVLVLVALGLFFYNMRADRATRFRALGDEESPDESGPSYEPVATEERHLSDLDSHGVDTQLPEPTTFSDIRLSDRT